MNCPECHHLPSGRFNADGAQCYCKCHDIADAAPDLLAVCEAVVAADQWPRPLGAPNAEQLIIRCAALARAVIAKAEGHP